MPAGAGLLWLDMWGPALCVCCVRQERTTHKQQQHYGRVRSSNNTMQATIINALFPSSRLRKCCLTLMRLWLCLSTYSNDSYNFSRSMQKPKINKERNNSIQSIQFNSIQTFIISGFRSYYLLLSPTEIL